MKIVLNWCAMLSKEMSIQWAKSCPYKRQAKSHLNYHKTYTENMSKFLLIAALSATALPLLLATKEEDEIKNLPGLTFEPNFKHYSGQFISWKSFQKGFSLKNWWKIILMVDLVFENLISNRFNGFKPNLWQKNKTV